MKGDIGPRCTVLVNSGAYVHQELSAEFGALPPAFLPVGLGRLYELQARMFAEFDCNLHLTLPESFALSDWDAERLCELGFSVIRTPDRLSLGAALLHALSVLGFSDRRLRILHGDTLLTDHALPAGVDLEVDDVVAVAHGGDGYRWAQVDLSEDGLIRAVSRPDQVAGATAGPRLCGYFAFADASRFAARLALAQGDIFDALNVYASGRELGAVTPAGWLDFGHVQSYFRSRRIVSTARAFNTLEIGEVRVRKRSGPAPAKIQAEARWLREAPPAVAPFCARLLGDGEDERGYFYDTEYEYMPTLAELYVFGRLGFHAWSRVLSSCGDFIDVSAASGAGVIVDGQLDGLVIQKTRDRLERYAASIDLDVESPNRLNNAAAPSLRTCLDDIATVVAAAGPRPSVMHGDFCFSNILYSFRTDRVRLIDPRGLTERGEFSLYGDVHYDLAKLMHSVSGRYDLIMAGKFRGRRVGSNAFTLNFAHDPWHGELETLARGLTMGGVSLGSDVVWAAMTSLFLSMAPLHADRPDRQSAFIANALRLRLAMDGARP